MSGARRGTADFPEAARRELANPQLRRNLGHATRTIREKRARAVAELDNWQQLRDAGAAIKHDVMANLDRYLVEFEQAATAAGARVHWASDAGEANRLIAGIVSAHGGGEVIKVKSVTTDEIGLNDALAESGDGADRDRLRRADPAARRRRSSHFLVPAIHRNRTEIRDLFRRTIGGPDLSDDPAELAETARRYLRERFLRARIGVSGANFAIAETGTLVILESEGNGRMCTTLPELLISVVGIEKLLPRLEHLGVFMQLLPRSSTAERMNPYTSMFTGVTAGDGPRELHIVLLDNGRSDVLADPAGREALHCIRCSACLNVCPVYERTGGHAYGSIYPGPIGAILGPAGRVGQHVAAAVVEQDDVQLARAVTGGDPREHRGVGVHPLGGELRGSSCMNTPRCSSRGSSFSMPTTLIRSSGSVVHMRPLPSDSRITRVPVSAIAKLAPLTPMRARRNRSRR